MYCLVYAVKLVGMYSTKNLIFFLVKVFTIQTINSSKLMLVLHFIIFFIVVPLKEEGAIMFSRSGMAKDYDFVTIIIFNFGNHYG